MLPRTLPDIETPALLIDTTILASNLKRMADFAQEAPCALRPHVKAHRLLEVCKRQIAAGAHGITCARLSEAEALAQNDVDHLLIANQVVGTSKWQRLARLARRTHVTVAIDNLEVAQQTAAAAREVGAKIGFLVDVNIGMDRCGVAPGKPAVELAIHCAALRGLRFRGVMGYEGHAVPMPREEKEVECRRAIGQLTETADMCRQAGLEVRVVSAGGTGTWDITGRHEGVTELQCGTYSLMDILFRETAGAEFDYAAWVMATVVSRPTEDRAVVDAGKKSLHPSFGMARPVGVPGAELRALYSEHGVLHLEGEARSLAVGDRVCFLPSYLEGTVNLFPRALAILGPDRYEEWEVLARDARG
jgi:D-serine deaminase-like pyridoxal phosphate-dependent protein